MDQQKMDIIAEDRRVVQERLAAENPTTVKEPWSVEEQLATQQLLTEDLHAQRNASRIMGLWMLFCSAAVNIALVIVCMNFFSGDGATAQVNDGLFITHFFESLLEFGVGVILLIVVACVGGASFVFGIVGAVLSLINGTNQPSDIALPLIGLGLHAIPVLMLFLI